MEYVIALAIILALLFTSAFFSGGELAMMALNLINIETEARKGSRLAKLQRYLRNRPQRFLSTILIGYNVANISLATYAAGLAHKYLAPLPQFSEETALALSAVVMTVLITIFAELMPKTIAAINTPGVAHWVTYPLYIMDLLFTPLNWLIEIMIMPMIRAMTRGSSAGEIKIGKEELATALALAHSGGEVHGTDARVAREALDLSTRSLAQVMTPRVDVLGVPEDTICGDVLQLMLDSGFTRLPVFKDSLDEITGVLLMKDLVRLSLRGHHVEGAQDWSRQPVHRHKRRIAHFPETKSVVEMLSEMQHKRLQMIVVVDEHGGTAGIVTMEDIIEELVGEIDDESDIGMSADIVRREENWLVVKGVARLDQLQELDDCDFSDSSATSIGGLMMEQLGRPAVVGDSIMIGEIKVTAVKVLRNRIVLLKLELGKSK